MKNSHEFVHEYLKKPEFAELMRRLGALGDGNQDLSMLLSSLSPNIQACIGFLSGAFP